MGIWGIFLILVLGLAIRILACQQTHIINPDGVYYIHQARALYYGEWHALTGCHLTFVSIYPFLIAGAYFICHHWVIAAQIVSVFFGSITLIPLYLLLRRFFERTISALTLLVFALLPFFVAGSASVVRDPICWFFLTLGLYLFLCSEENHYPTLLLLASLSFLMASWARIESILFILVGGLYLIVVPQEKRLQKFFFFFLPLLLALTIVLCAALLLNKPLGHTLRLAEVMHKLSGPFVAYETLRGDIAGLMSQFSPDDVMPHFLHKTRNMVWLVALGTLVKYMARAYFYVFLIVLIIGIGKTWHGLKTDRRVLYLSLTALSALLLLYVHLLQTWMMFDRFWAIFILPAAVSLGFGFEKAVSVLNTRLHLKEWIGIFLLCLMILTFALPKDLKSRETDKRVFKEISGCIAQRETGRQRPIRILTSERSPNWISFYANLDYPAAPCPMENVSIENMVGKGYPTFVKTLTDEGVDYCLYEERYWPDMGFAFPKDRVKNDFKKVGEWHHPDTGRLILYKVAP